MENIVEEKHVGIKEEIKIISSLNASQKLLVSEVLKLVKLFLSLPITNAVTEKLRSTLCCVKTYLRSSIIQEPVSSCLIVTTYIKEVDKLKLVEAARLLCFNNEHCFQLKKV